MRFLYAAIFITLIFTNAKAALTTEVLALRLWNAYDKETNASYEALDNYRLKLDKNNPVKAKLNDPENFKKYQEILRNRFIDKVSKEFNRKEIIALTTIYKRPEMTKMRLFRMDFFDDNELVTLFEGTESDLAPPPQPESTDPALPPLPPK